VLFIPEKLQNLHKLLENLFALLREKRELLEPLRHQLVKIFYCGRTQAYDGKYAVETFEDKNGMFFFS
jgi:hypothetical protein